MMIVLLADIDILINFIKKKQSLLKPNPQIY